MTAAISTEAGRAAALSMFEEVPCIFQLSDAGCENPAKWIAHFVHEEKRSECADESSPVCETHKTAIQRTSIPFWRVWFALEPISCDRCTGPLRLDRFEALG
jgi:hypothetical protein